MAYEMDNEFQDVTNIKVIGVGGGGGNAVNRMVQAGLTQLDVRDRLQITATYQNRIVLKLGEAASVANKTDFIKATLDRCEQNTPGFKGSIDFSIDKKAFQNAEEESTTTAPVSETPLQGNATEEPNSETTAKAA